MIEAKELTKTFGAVKAVRGVSFAVKRGEAVGFLGPNGAGKTTTFRMLAGTLAPDSGRVQILGKSMREYPICAKAQMGYMAENAPLYPELTAMQYLRYRAELRGIRKSERTTAIERAASKAGITGMLGVRIGHLSKGYRQRTALSDALLGDPKVLLLDEPTAGLDPNQVLETRRLIRELAKDHAVILSTHILSEVEATCDRALVINQGRLIAQGTLQELKSGGHRRRAQVRVTGNPTELGVLLKSFDFNITSETVAGCLDELELSFQLADKAQLARVVRHLVAANFEVTHAAEAATPLDEVFAQLTGENLK